VSDVTNDANSKASMCPNVPSTNEADGTKCAGICPDVPESGKKPENFLRGTNPLAARPRRLSYGQHAAARLIVQGHGSLAVARELGVNHHTIGRWKRDPRFVAEVERLRQSATEIVVARTAMRMARDATQQAPRRLPPATTAAPPADFRKPTSPDPDIDSLKGEALVTHMLQRARQFRDVATAISRLE
jgi:hypothetical protein